MKKCKKCGQKEGVHKLSCETNVKRIEIVIEFYRERGCNSELANKVKRKIIDK